MLQLTGHQDLILGWEGGVRVSGAAGLLVTGLLVTTVPSAEIARGVVLGDTKAPLSEALWSPTPPSQA